MRTNYGHQGSLKRREASDNIQQGYLEDSQLAPIESLLDGAVSTSVFIRVLRPVKICLYMTLVSTLVKDRCCPQLVLIEFPTFSALKWKSKVTKSRSEVMIQNWDVLRQSTTILTGRMIDINIPKLQHCSPCFCKSNVSK